MRLIALCAGTGSDGMVVKNLWWDVVRLYMDYRSKPDIVADIQTVEYQCYSAVSFLSHNNILHLRTYTSV